MRVMRAMKLKSRRNRKNRLTDNLQIKEEKSGGYFCESG